VKGYRTDSSFGLVETGRYTSEFYPTGQKVDKTKAPVIFTHGSGAQWGYVDSTRLGSRLSGPLHATAGFPVIASELGAQAWGNDTAMTAIDACFARVKSNWGITASKFHLSGGSMGGLTALRYATLHPEKVASVTVLFPLCNLINFWNGQTTTVKNEISGAWGVANGTAPPNTSDIRAGLQAIAGQFPVRIYYSSADAIVSVPDILDAANRVQAEVCMDVGPNGHSEQTVLDYYAATNYCQSDFARMNLVG
jgi:hypothetical protein